MRSTAECEMMNTVYAMLKNLSISQLHEYRDQVLLDYGKNIEASELLLHQVDFTIERKISGRW